MIRDNWVELSNKKSEWLKNKIKASYSKCTDKQ